MADEDEPETRWDRIRVRLISIALLVAIVLFLYRLPDTVERFLPDADVIAMAAFLIPAALMLVPTFIMVRDARKVRRWPRVPGVVVSTAMVSMTHPQSAATSRRPVVRYRYTVDGVERRGDTLWFGRKEGGNEGWARKVLARHPVGAEIGVHCNPSDPEQTALEASASPFVWALLVLGLLLLLGAVYAAGLI